VVEDEEPITLKAFLMDKKGVSRRLISRLKLQENGITCNGEHIRTVEKVQKGDKIELKMHDSSFLEPNNSLKVPVVYESDSVIVFDKPIGMPVHPSIKHQGDTLGNYFASLYPKLTFRPINRLDRDTSGLCLVAKNAHSANVVKPEKIYYAAVSGKIDSSGTIREPIARVADSIILRCVSPNGQDAITHYKVLSSNDKYSLLEVKLETGRTHQIRVHFSYIGYPLVGDDMYGGSTDDITGQALHCGKLIFFDPSSNKSIRLESKIRKDMKNLF
jgi:23S rRNA pseudouridine1911/1915/1917 synthase